MERDFGCPLTDLFREHQKVPDTHPALKMRQHRRGLQMYVFVKKSAIVGCLLMEKIETASPLVCSEEGVEEKSVAHGGVVLLWAAQRCRRQGIASTLLDVAR